MAKAFPTDNPFLRGYYAPLHMECEAPNLPVSGDIPKALNGSLYRNLPFDPERDFVAVATIATVPFVRSVNLLDGGRLYCSSLFGAFEEPVDSAAYVAGRLRLLAGNPVTPNRPLIVYREEIGAFSVLGGALLAWGAGW